MLRVSRVVAVGGFDQVKALSLGGGFPVAVQTMWKESLDPAGLREGRDGEPPRVIRRIGELQDLGCALLRFAVPDLAAAETLGDLASRVSLPLSADIHFDYRIALRCLDFPIAKIRINPGNIGGRDRVEKVLDKAASRGVPIRIGLNAGSLPRDLAAAVDKGERDRPDALVEAAERELALFREFGFPNVVISLKASSAAETIRANRRLADRTDAPLHIGVTEAGPLVAGVVRNTAALYTLLSEGIGDTIRVSLSDTMENEIIAGREILNTLDQPRDQNEKKTGAVIISCPRCGRNSFDTHDFTRRWVSRLYSLKKDITIAVMGCAVNGPGEARHADLGITGAGDRVLIFRRGKVVRTVEAARADAAFEEELGRF